jgi:hypothetical protein
MDLMGHKDLQLSSWLGHKDLRRPFLVHKDFSAQRPLALLVRQQSVLSGQPPIQLMQVPMRQQLISFSYDFLLS